ncbi:MAG: ATP-binding cassette domain-containing protein [Spirochaetia bacterium]
MVLLSAENLSFANKEDYVFQNLSFEIKKNEKVLLHGISGSGKSSILKMILGFAKPESGIIRYNGKILAGPAIWHFRRESSYVPQNPQIGNGTAIKILREIFSFKYTSPLPNTDRILETAERLSLNRRTLEQSFDSLPGGEKQRVAVLIALLRERNIFILDEPTSSLDADLQKKVISLFSENPKWTVITASHDPLWQQCGNFQLIYIAEGASG